MDIAIGLPSTIPSTDGPTIVEWARRAEEAGFAGLGTLDRVVYGNYDPIVTLTAAAAVTADIRLTTSILITPYRGNGALLAKQLASLDQLSLGRLTVGIAVGGRSDDFTATGSDFDGRGRVQDQLLTELRDVWSGEPRGTAGAIGPRPMQPGGPPLLMGGNSRATLRRMTEHGAGWISGGGGSARFAEFVPRVRQAWDGAGRPGVPWLGALAYFALGANAKDRARAYLTDYYAFIGPFAERVAESALIDTESLQREVAAFAEAGCDELILFPCSPDADEIDLLAAATLR